MFELSNIDYLCLTYIVDMVCLRETKKYIALYALMRNVVVPWASKPFGIVNKPHHHHIFKICLNGTVR